MIVEIDNHSLIFGDWCSFQSDVWAKPIISNLHSTYNLYDSFQGICLIQINRLWNIRFIHNYNLSFSFSKLYKKLSDNSNKEYPSDQIEQFKDDIDKFLIRINKLKTLI